MQWKKNSPIYILADFVYIRHIYIHILVCITNMYTYILMYNTSIERGLAADAEDVAAVSEDL